MKRLKFSEIMDDYLKDWKIHTDGFIPNNKKEYGTFKYGSKVWEGSFTLDTDQFKEFYKHLPPPSYELRQPYTRVPNGTYTPKDFGFDFPKCQIINVSKCPAQLLPLSFVIAHAHDDAPIMCITDGTYVFKDEGVPDDAVLHEYAHLLVGGKEHGHDKVWEKAARDLGVVNPGPSLPYNYYGNPKTLWSGVKAT